MTTNSRRSPFPPGDWTDIEIFCQALIHKLDDGERVEADDGYIGEAPKYIICPASISMPQAHDAIHRQIEGRQESSYKHFKFFQCLSRKMRDSGTAEEKMDKHNSLFRATVIIKQVAMEMGVGQLYDIDYRES